MEYYGCSSIDYFPLMINGRLDNEDVIALCCETIQEGKRPSVPLEDEAADTVRNLIDMRFRLINEGYPGVERKISVSCLKCVRYEKSDWKFDGKINYIGFSPYPSPCQCRCCYCDVYAERQIITPEIAEKYERLFEMLEYAKRVGAIAPNAVWQISCGEISIHPYKERIIQLTKGQHVDFFTNCMKYDEKIAEELKNNPHARINLSIDSGTPETWKKVKGVDNFETVATNLTKYYLAGSRPGQITLKYILLPGINDRAEDYETLIEMMKLLKVSHLKIARDARVKYSILQSESNKLAVAAGEFMARLYKKGISFELQEYRPEEENLAIAIAKRLLETERI